MGKVSKQCNEGKAEHYSEEAITKCIARIRGENGKSKLSVYAACKLYNVPMSTARYRLSDQWKNKSVPGPRSVLTREEEVKIADWLTGMQERGFPVSRETLIFKVADFLRSNPRDTPFKNNRPGRKWFASFMRRNPGFSLRTPEAISSASARVSENDIRGWFRTIHDWLAKNDLLDLLDHPERIYNGDETSFYLHPKSKEVIARTGSRNVYEVEQAPGKQNVTVMFSFNAAGAVVNPHVILPGQRIRKEVVAGFPSDWGLGQSERGWMDVNNFREYIQKIFYPYLVRQNVQFPVIFFVDGHASHKSVEVADLCQSLGIILISLYPNTTHITQPADVAVFKPLKDEWRRAVLQWRSEHHGEILTLSHFGKVLAKTVEQGIKPSSITNGFRVCGLCPFNSDNVDYSKCLARKRKLSQDRAEVDCPIAETRDPVILTPEAESPVATCPESPQLQLPPVSIRTPHEYVPLQIEKIVQAVDMIGTQTMRRIEGDVYSLSKEERIIRFFFREFVKPYVSVNNNGEVELNRENCINWELISPTTVTLYENPATTDNSTFIPSVAEVHGSIENEIAPIENEILLQDNSIILDLIDYANDQCPTDSGNFPHTDAPSTVDDPTAANKYDASDNEDLLSTHSETCSTNHLDAQISVPLANAPVLQCNEIVKTTDFEPRSLNPMSDNQPSSSKVANNSYNVAGDIDNNPEVFVFGTRRLSQVLELPPTPRRVGKHRNYSQRYHPVLTAKERLEEIRKKENEKKEMEERKKQRALEREAIKLKREESKQMKAEERQRKMIEKKKKQEQSKLKVIRRTSSKFTTK